MTPLPLRHSQRRTRQTLPARRIRHVRRVSLCESADEAIHVVQLFYSVLSNKI